MKKAMLVTNIRITKEQKQFFKDMKKKLGEVWEGESAFIRSLIDGAIKNSNKK